MKILLIYPSRLLPNGKIMKLKSGLFCKRLSLAIIAALTPSEFEVNILDDYMDEIDYDTKVDLVGISTLTVEAPRAYQIADNFRQRGKKVVLGGIHPTLLPEEAKKYADSVVIGEAENVWLDLLVDFKNNQLKPFYKSDKLCDLDKIPLPRIDLLGLPKRSTFYPILTSRGCPYSCDYCSVTTFFGRTFRHRSVESIIKEIIEIKSQHKSINFYDDNIIADYNFAKELFTALIPLKINWSSQMSLKIVHHPELLELAKESGCRCFTLGVESIYQKSLDSVNKEVNQLGRIEDGIKKIKAKNINIIISFIFGFDYDDKEVFDNTLAFLKRNKPASAIFQILTPYPGTRIYQRFLSQGRILTHDWSKYNLRNCVFQPRNMSPKYLEQRVVKLYHTFYSPVNLLKRVIFSKNKIEVGFINTYSVQRFHFLLPFLLKFLYFLDKTKKIVFKISNKENI